MDFLPLPHLQIPTPLPPSHTPTTTHFLSYRHPLFLSLPSPLTSLSFSPSKPHRLAITTGTRSLLYATKGGKVVKSITRFKGTARGCDVRVDGRLMCAGDEGAQAGVPVGAAGKAGKGGEASVVVFDLGSRAVLRTLKGHEGPIHQTRFSPSLSNPLILSASDDASLNLYDLPTSTLLQKFIGHGDYVRSCVFSGSGEGRVFLSGGYEGGVKLWDSRVGGSANGGEGSGIANSGCVMTMHHGPAVEDILLFPSTSQSSSSNIAISAGGPIMRVWDLTMGGRCIRALSNHQKTITSLAFEGMGSNGGQPKRVLSGGLDMMLKIYDIESWTVGHTMRYPAPILNVGVSPDDTIIAVGMSDGTLSLKRREVSATKREDEKIANMAISNGAYELFPSLSSQFAGTDLAPKSRKEKLQLARKEAASGMSSNVMKDEEEIKVEETRKKRLKGVRGGVDVLLRGFRYREALDLVMGNQTRPLTAFSLITELIYRDALRSSLSGRDDVTLQPVLAFLAKNVTDPRFGELVVEVMDMVLDIYGDVLGQSPLIDDLVKRMQRSIRAELGFQQELVMLKGGLEMVLAQSALAQSA